MITSPEHDERIREVARGLPLRLRRPLLANVNLRLSGFRGSTLPAQALSLAIDSALRELQVVAK
jgi:hypothetical protein